MLYLEDKKDFMATTQHFVFLKGSHVPKDLKPKLLKQAFTAISFGARQTAKGWLDAMGNWTNPALVEILQNSDDRARFLADDTVKLFIKEQNALDEYLYALFKRFRPDLLLQKYLQTDSGRPSKAKVLAYLYQHGETHVMNIVRQVAMVNGRVPIANVHDAIFFKRALGVDLKCVNKQGTLFGTSRPSKLRATRHVPSMPSVGSKTTRIGWHLSKQELRDTRAFFRI
jgi:hypothetical protein